MNKKWRLTAVVLALGLASSCSDDSARDQPIAESPKALKSSSELLYTDGIFLEVTAWGPRAAQQGQRFNVQGDGSSAFWIEVKEKDPEAVYVLWLDDVPIETKSPISSNLITGSLSAEKAEQIVANPGIQTVSVVEMNQKLHQRVGDFLIE